MKFKKIIGLTLLIIMAVSFASCGTIDMMVGLKEGSEKSNFEDMGKINEEIANNGGEQIIDDILSTSENTDKIDENKVISYYLDENNYVVPVAVNINKNENDVLMSVLKGMIIGSEIETELSHSGLKGVFPNGTEILSATVENGVCTVDFNRQILTKESYKDESDMITALTYTLTEFTGVNNVEILVDGRLLNTLAHGYPANTPFQRKNINLLGASDGVNYTVFYKTHETEVEGHYVPFTFSAEKVGNLANIAIDRLFNGKTDELNVSNNIPVGISLNKSEIKNGIAHIDLSMEALNIEQEEYEDVKEIVTLCLQQFGEIKDIEFSIEGISFEEAGLDIIDEDIIPVFSNTK